MAQVAGTAPYPWPYDGDLNPRRIALIAVGCQRWWTGRTQGVDETLDALSSVADAVRSAGGSVFIMRHGTRVAPSNGRSKMPVRRSPDWQLAVGGRPEDVVVDCAGMNAFYGGELDRILRSMGRDHLIVGGLGLETAVYSTMTGANDRGYECLALIDGSASHDPEVAERALSSITMSGGIFGAIGSSQELCEALGSSKR